MKYLLCGQPEIMSVTEMREWEKELLSLDQRDDGVIYALSEVRRELAERESGS